MSKIGNSTCAKSQTLSVERAAMPILMVLRSNDHNEPARALEDALRAAMSPDQARAALGNIPDNCRPRGYADLRIAVPGFDQWVDLIEALRCAVTAVMRTQNWLEPDERPQRPLRRNK